jgi:hypothetical protein
MHSAHAHAKQYLTHKGHGAGCAAEQSFENATHMTGVARWPHRMCSSTQGPTGELLLNPGVCYGNRSAAPKHLAHDGQRIGHVDGQVLKECNQVCLRRALLLAVLAVQRQCGAQRIGLC